jgi:hypothetical protein
LWRGGSVLFREVGAPRENARLDVSSSRRPLMHAPARPGAPTTGPAHTLPRPPHRKGSSTCLRAQFYALRWPNRGPLVLSRLRVRLRKEPRSEAQSAGGNIRRRGHPFFNFIFEKIFSLFFLLITSYFILLVTNYFKNETRTGNLDY